MLACRNPTGEPVDQPPHSGRGAPHSRRVLELEAPAEVDVLLERVGQRQFLDAALHEYGEAHSARVRAGRGGGVGGPPLVAAPLRIRSGRGRGRGCGGRRGLAGAVGARGG